jgi:hypothetical protein
MVHYGTQWLCDHIIVYYSTLDNYEESRFWEIEFAGAVA